MLKAEKLKNDLRVKEAKRLLKNALEDTKKEITKVRGPRKKEADKFEGYLELAATNRSAPLFYDYIGSGLGNGSLVELLDGSIKYDFITGIGVHYMGHSNIDIMLSGIDAALSDTVMQGHLQQNANQIGLMSKFIHLAKLGGMKSKLDHCFLTSSGAMANENAMKILFQKKYPANRMLAFKKCFAGRTLALANMTDKHAYRDGLPESLQVDYIPFYDEQRPTKSIKHAVAALKRHIERFPGKHAGMCFELIQGEGGYFPGNTEFFKAIISVLKENDIPVWIDEVQTFGRTDFPFAFQHFGLEQDVDIVTAGKMSQVCATIFTKEFKPRPGLISQTFTSSSSAIEASSVVLDGLISGKFLKNNIGIHNIFVQQIEKLAKKYPAHFTGPYGLGGMIGFTVFEGNMDRTKEFTHKLFKNGVMSFIAGKNPTRVRFLPPVMSITIEDIENAFKIIDKTFKEMV
jgi:acetylornithine aminotransferase